MEKKKYFSIIVAGGTGSRIGGNLPKQFIEIEGKPILRHTLEKFQALPFHVELIVVLNSEMKEYWKKYCLEYEYNFRYYLVSGGFTRFHSVKNAVKYLKPGGIVAVHDGVRPFVSVEFLKKMYLEAEKCDALIPVVKPADSLRQSDTPGSEESHAVDRENFLMVQTPQMFRTEVLIDSYKQSYNTLFSDDASVVENRGYTIRTTTGERLNFKITTPEDLRLATALMEDSPL